MTPQALRIAQALADAIAEHKRAAGQPPTTPPACSIVRSSPIIGWPASGLNREELEIRAEGERRRRDFFQSRYYAQQRRSARRSR